jgi:hypothetical protein
LTSCWGDLLADAGVADHDLGDRGRAEEGQARDVQLEHQAAVLLRSCVAELDLDPAGDHDRGELVQDGEDLHLLARADLDRDVLRDQAHEVLELLGEDPRRGLGRRRVVRVAAAGVGHPQQQLLVEVVAEPDRGRADVLGGGGALGHLHERAAVGDADVGQAVGEQQDLAGAVRGQVIMSEDGRRNVSDHPRVSDTQPTSPPSLSIRSFRR